jgi:hypothetical protein
LHQRPEPLLVLGARELREAVVVLEDEPHHGRPFRRALDLVSRRGSLEVPEGAGGGGDGQAVVNDGIEGGGAVDSDARARSSAASLHGHVYFIVSLAEAPDRGRRLVAEHRIRTDRQHRRHLASVRRPRRADLVHAVMHADEPAGFDSPRDAPPPNPRIEELRGRDDAVLPGSEGQHGVHFCNLRAAQRQRLQKLTYRARFCIIGGAGRRMLQKCTLGRDHGPEHPTGTPGPTPSMPQLIRTRHAYDTESYAAATFDQSTTFHHASM